MWRQEKEEWQILREKGVENKILMEVKSEIFTHDIISICFVLFFRTKFQCLLN